MSLYSNVQCPCATRCSVLDINGNFQWISFRCGEYIHVKSCSNGVFLSLDKTLQGYIYETCSLI